MSNPSQKKIFLTIDNGGALGRSINRISKELFPDVQVISSKSSEEGIQFAKNKKINILFLDTQMGLENCEKILKKFPKKNRIFPAVILSADKSEDLLSQLFELGADDSLTKPIDELIFESKIKSLLEQKYISPLSFLGRKKGIAPVTLEFHVTLTGLSERNCQFTTPFFISTGAELKLNLEENLILPLKIIKPPNYEKEIFAYNSNILSGLMDLEQRARLRRFILKQDKKTKHKR